MSRATSLDSAEQQVRNLWNDPMLLQWPSLYASNRVSMTSTNHWTVTDTTNATGDGNPPQRVNAIVYSPSSGPLTILMQMRGSYALSVGMIWNNGSDPGGAPNGQPWLRKTTVPASPVNWVWVRMVLPANTVAGPQAASWSAGLGDGTTKTTNDWFEINRIMIVAGKYTGEYADGSTPGWKWDGSANSTSSVGYPYTLSRMAGGAAPVLALGPTAPSGSIVYGYPAQAEYTVYSVQSNTSPANLDGYWQANGAGTRVSRLMATNTSTIQPLIFGAGGANGSPSTTFTPTNTNIFAVRVSQVLGLVKGNVNNGATISGTSTGVNAGYSDGILVGSRDGFAVPIVTSAFYVYPGMHSDSQVTAITRWLGMKYGVTVQ